MENVPKLIEDENTFMIEDQTFLPTNKDIVKILSHLSDATRCTRYVDKFCKDHNMSEYHAWKLLAPYILLNKKEGETLVADYVYQALLDDSAPNTTIKGRK